MRLRSRSESVGTGQRVGCGPEPCPPEASHQGQAARQRLPPARPPPRPFPSPSGASSCPPAWLSGCSRDPSIWEQLFLEHVGGRGALQRSLWSQLSRLPGVARVASALPRDTVSGAETPPSKSQARLPFWSCGIRRYRQGFASRVKFLETSIRRRRVRAQRSIVSLESSQLLQGQSHPGARSMGSL